MVQPVVRLNRFGIVIALIAAGGFVLRLVYASRQGDFAAISDPNYYHLQANLIADGRGFIDPFSWIFDHHAIATAAHPPLFALVLSVASTLGATSEMAHRVLGCLIGTGTIVAVAYLGRAIGGRRVGVIAAAIAAVYPNLWVFDAGVFAESLELLLISLLLLCIYRLAAEPGWKQAVLLGGLTGLLALTRAELVLLVPFLILPAFWTRIALPIGRRLALVGISFLVVLVVISPWMIRNATAFSKPVLMSTNGDLFVAYTNCASAYAGPGLGWFDPRCAPASVFKDRTKDEAERMVAARKQGLRYARAHVGRLLGVVVWARIGRTWNLFRPDQTAQLEVPEDRPKDVSVAGTLFFYPLLALAIFGAFALHRRHRAPLWPLLVPPVIATVTAAAFAGNVRFRAIAEPCLVVLAAFAIAAIVRAVQTRTHDPNPATGTAATTG